MSEPVKAVFVTTKLEEALTMYARRLNGMPMDILAEGLITAVDDLIQNEGNGQWPDLAPSTLRRHPRRRGGSLLQDTGQLANIQQAAGSPGPDWVEVASPAPYAIYHVSQGTRRVIPLRDFLDIDFATVLDDIAVDVMKEIE